LIRLCIGGNRHLHHLAEHARYGPIVRISPNALSFNTSTALQTIYSGGNKTNVRKSEWYEVLDAGSGAFSLATERDKGRHAQRRRFVLKAFSADALRQGEVFVRENVSRFCELIGPGASAEKASGKVTSTEKKEKDDEWSEPRDMSVWCTWLAFDIMGDLAFGTRFGCIEKEEYRFIPRAIMSANKFLYWVRMLFCTIAYPFPAPPHSITTLVGSDSSGAGNGKHGREREKMCLVRPTQRSH
jgi:hypothetical protein